MTLEPAERLARLRLARTEGIGAITARGLINRPGGAIDALTRLPALTRGRVVKLPDLASARAEDAAITKLGGRILVIGDPDYPPALAATEDAPIALSVFGDVAILSRRAVAIVGARNASAGGRMLAERLARDLAAAGIVVVSGLARGIDAAAHEGALAGGGLTVAAIAGGLDVPYPPENAGLQARIAAAGVVVAESPLGTVAYGKLFPRRNRIIAGLSLGVVVVEAALKSGSLMTARLGLEAGRELFAVPGSPIDPRSLGSNDLIRQGAHLVETAVDVLDHLPKGFDPAYVRSGGFALTEAAEEDGFADAPMAEAPVSEYADEVSEAVAFLETLLGPSPVSVDEVLRRCPCSGPAVSAALLELDLAGRIERLPGNRVALIA